MTEFLFEIGSQKDWSLFILRFALGFVFFYHGMPRLTNPSRVAQRSAIPTLKMVVLLFGIVEVFTGLALLFGIYEKLAALVLFNVIIAATFIRGFQVKPRFSVDGVTTWEFEVVFAAAALIIFINGGGNITLFRFLGIL